jgi:putative hydrolase
MSDTRGSWPDDPSGDAFAESPLFREIQRVLTASPGPVNWELARQVGIASAVMAGEDPVPSEDDRRSFEDAVRVAELQVAGFTGLGPPADVAPVEAVRRAQWVQRNVEGLRELVDPAAERIGEAMSGAMPPGVPQGGDEQPFGIDPRALLGQLSPLLLGAQVGSVLGSLAQQVLGQYDIAVPRPAPGSLYFVVPNIAAFERDWSLPPTDFRTWVAIHEVTHRFEFARPWTRSRFRELLDDFLATRELDLSAFRDRLATLDPSSPEAFQELVGSEEGLFGTLLDDEQRLKLRRIQAFMAAAEGYGDHVTHAIGRTLLPSYARIEEAMRRYRESEHADPVFERLLGIEIKRDQYRLGRSFCDTVADRTDEATLTRMWDDADALPSLPELGEPTLWLSRIA